VIASDLRRAPSCPKLESYWHFHGCRYNKSRYTCAEPDHLPGCPLPKHWLRNGRLNQTAYALHLFIRDVAGGDLVGWIDRRLNTAARHPGPDRLARMRTAVLGPLKEVYGVSDKILMMALSVLFLGAPGRRRRWLEVGGSMIAVDTLVHNFLHRTGILHRFRADHPYGVACYRPGGCADIIETVARQIDARQFNRQFPRTFPRFVQHAIWRYCSQQRDAKLAEAQQAQADLIRKQRELDDAKREMDLNIQKQVQAELGAVRDQAKQEAEAALTLRVREKEEQIASMQRQIEDLRRKAEQGSQQLQGEVQELALEALLRQKFPRDAFEPVPKGEFGGDLIQRVVGPAGQICGSILWEAKRTKNWSDGWLGKVREDQRAAKADMALIVSHALPKGLQAFDQIDGVWVTEPRCAVAVAIALRESLIALAAARLAGEGQQTKMKLVYQYLTGPR
jgi:hypothetical protein